MQLDGQVDAITHQVAPNLLKRKFDAKRPNQKWVTDVTEFRVGGQKLYLSPMLDLYNGEIIAFKPPRHPPFDMVGAMLRQAFERLRPCDKPILHSAQYRMPIYRRVLHEQRRVYQQDQAQFYRVTANYIGTQSQEGYQVQFQDTQQGLSNHGELSVAIFFSPAIQQIVGLSIKQYVDRWSDHFARLFVCT